MWGETQKTQLFQLFILCAVVTAVVSQKTVVSPAASCLSRTVFIVGLYLECPNCCRPRKSTLIELTQGVIVGAVEAHGQPPVAEVTPPPKRLSDHAMPSQLYRLV